MTQEFQPTDFEPLYDQTLILTTSISSSDNNLSALLLDLTTIHTHLSALITRATNPRSLLRKRCSDRHGDWLQLQFDLQNTLCETQDLLNSLEKPDDSVDIDVDGEYAKLIKVSEELSAHAFLIGEFVDSLGLSKLARKDPALGEIERILIDAAREEREKDPEGIEDVPEVNRLGGLWGIHRLLIKNGVDKREVMRLDTKIKQTVCWVFRNEPQLTMVKYLEDMVEEEKDDWYRSPVPEYPKGLEVRKKPMMEQHGWGNIDEENDDRCSQAPTGLTKKEERADELGESSPYEERESKSNSKMIEDMKEFEEAETPTLKSGPAKTEVCWLWKTPGKHCRFTAEDCNNLHSPFPVDKEPNKPGEGEKSEEAQKPEDDFLAVEKEDVEDELGEYVWV